MLKVGFIGPKWIEKMIKSSFSMFPNIEVTYRLSDDIYDAIPFTKEIMNEVDCILYSSRATYLLANDGLNQSIKSYYLPLKGSGFYEALFYLVKDYSIEYISIDGLAKEYIQSVMDQINGIDYDIVEHLGILGEYEKIVQLHLEAINGRSNIGIITSIKKVKDALDERGLPVVWLKPTQQDIIVCIERILLSSNQRKQRENQMIYGKFIIEYTEKTVQTLNKKARIKYKLERALYHFVDEMYGYIIPVSEAEYHFIAYRGDFERITEGYKILNIFKEINQYQELRISLGVGFGMSIPVSVFHADLAVRQCKQHSSNIAFIVNEARKVIGPIIINIPTVYHLTDNEKESQNKQIEKIKTYILKNNLKYFTSDEVAINLNVTKRAANRIISSWMDSELIEVYGLEKVNGRGRPRQCYIFKEVAYENRLNR
ncbi:MAG TPA: hypothetical protein VNR38_05840 [Ureibacillus sp.]|nr:hypothetical protein [Ureibacillus sp.]